MKKKLWFSLGFAAVLAIAMVTSYFSPVWTMHKIHSAAKEKETDRLSDYVDFPALRENFKAMAMTAMASAMSKNEEADSPFGKLGMMLATTLLNSMVDAMVSPAGLTSLIVTGKPPDLQSLAKNEQEKAASDQNIDVGFSYTAWDRVIIFRKGHFDDGHFIMRRNGIWSWKLVAIKMPIDAAGIISK